METNTKVLGQLFLNTEIEETAWSKGKVQQVQREK